MWKYGLHRLIRQVARNRLTAATGRSDQERGKAIMPKAIPWCDLKVGALAVVLTTAAVGSSLTGCSSLYYEGAAAGAGVAGAAVASTVTRNAAVASGIGLGAFAAARAGAQYSPGVMHAYSHAPIAAATGASADGPLPP